MRWGHSQRHPDETCIKKLDLDAPEVEAAGDRPTANNFWKESHPGCSRQTFRKGKASIKRSSKGIP